LVENSNKSTSTRSYDETKQKKVFMAFKYYYGVLWLSKFDAEAGTDAAKKQAERNKQAIKRVWAVALDELSHHQIDEGIKKIMMGKSPFSRYVPNPGEFAELCRAQKEPQVPDFKSLPKPPADKEAAKVELDKCWKLLGLGFRGNK